MNFYQSVHAIVAIYVDDLNLVGAPKELTKTTNRLKNEFEMKNLGKTKFCLGLQIEHLPNEILVHQSKYIEKAHRLSTPMVVQSLDDKKDLFQPQEDDEETLAPELPYLSAIGALMYLAITHDLIQHLQLTYQQGIVLHQLEDIEMELSIFYVIVVRLLI